MRTTRVEFFRDALTRLENEAGTIISLIEEHNRRSPRKIGFWAGIRLLMPIVEAVAHVAGESPQEFLGAHLHVEVPNLMWDLFRHSLIHGDYPHTAKYGNKEVKWGISFSGMEHDVMRGTNMPSVVGVDIPTLYGDLKAYLETEVAKNDQTQVDIEVGVIYHTPKPNIEEEFNNL